MLWNFILISIFINVVVPPSGSIPSNCDLTYKNFLEGNIGQTNHFPWLGVLKVHLHEGGSFRVALSGLVLVKDHYALINADDVSRVPRKVLLEDSQVMFIVSEQAQHFKVKDYMTHPDYMYSTLNTVALLEINVEGIKFPVKPICWPTYRFNTSNELYVVSYVDDNKLLEKMLNRVEFVSLPVCEEFYQRAGLSEGKSTPINYHCAVASKSTENCVWENGAALVSNSSGVWKMVGFGIRGPGCAAPARFLDMIPLISWIKSTTDVYSIDNVDDFDNSRRKSAFSLGFGNQNVKVERDVPIHTLTDKISPYGYRRADEKLHYWDDRYQKNLTKEFDGFEMGTTETKYFSVQTSGTGDGAVIWAAKVSLAAPYKFGDCGDNMRLVYRDETKIVSPWRSAVATYSVSVYDLYAINYTCIKILAHPPSNTKSTKIYHAVTMGQDDMSPLGNPDFPYFGQTPEELLKFYTVKGLYQNKPKYVNYSVYDNPDQTEPEEDNNTEVWTAGPHLQPKVIEMQERTLDLPNINIVFKIAYVSEMLFKIAIYSEKIPFIKHLPKPPQKRRMRVQTERTPQTEEPWSSSLKRQVEETMETPALVEVEDDPNSGVCLRCLKMPVVSTVLLTCIVK